MISNNKNKNSQTENLAADEQYEVLIEQISKKLEAGEPVDLEGYLSEYPRYAERLRRTVPAMFDLGLESVSGSSKQKRDGEPAGGTLGVTLYELLTLRPAFTTEDRKKLLQQVTEDDPPRPRQVNPALPKDLETILPHFIKRKRTSKKRKNTGSAPKEWRPARFWIAERDC